MHTCLELWHQLHQKIISYKALLSTNYFAIASIAKEQHT